MDGEVRDGRDRHARDGVVGGRFSSAEPIWDDEDADAALVLIRECPFRRPADLRRVGLI
jgi:hypothetical protein